MEKLSLALCGLLAVAFAIMVPPFQVSDEHGHFVRAYVISRGEYVAQGLPKIPAPIISTLTQYPEAAEVVRKVTIREIVSGLWETPDSNSTGNMTPSNDDHHHEYLVWAMIGSATYFPLVYLPASLGIGTARLLHLSPLAMMYAARLFNVLTFVGALGIAFRLAPEYRALLTAVALTPMTLQQAGGISGDAVTISFSFLGFAMVLCARRRRAGTRFLLLTGLVFIAWGLCKFSVWALPLLLLIPASNFRNRRSRFAYVGAVSISVVLALMMWGRVSAANVAVFRAARSMHGVDISANTRLVTAHPLTFGIQLAGLVRAGYKKELAQFLGGFGWSLFTLPFWVRFPYFVLILVVAAVEPPILPFVALERGVLFLVFLAGAVFVHAAIFISDGTLCQYDVNRLCFNASWGIQGRYFLPLCLAGLLPLRQKWVNLSQTTVLALVMAAGTLHALAALALIRSSFFG